MRAHLVIRLCHSLICEWPYIYARLCTCLTSAASCARALVQLEWSVHHTSLIVIALCVYVHDFLQEQEL
eukprot:1132853-Amphidinium_carterae.3